MTAGLTHGAFYARCNNQDELAAAMTSGWRIMDVLLTVRGQLQAPSVMRSKRFMRPSLVTACTDWRVFAFHQVMKDLPSCR